MAEATGNGESVKLCDRQCAGAVCRRYACGRDGGAGGGGGGYGVCGDCAVSEDWGVKEVCGKQRYRQNKKSFGFNQ